MDYTAANGWLWALFGGVFVLALAADLFIFQRKAHIVAVKEALWLSLFWIVLALAFGLVVYLYMGHEKLLEFLAAYLVEKSLSIDNLFVFLAILTYFGVPREAHRKVLLWGILGAIFFRAIFIFAGIALIQRFHFILYLLGIILIYTAFKLVFQKEKEVDPEKNPVVKLARRFIRCETKYDGTKFLKRVDGLVCATPLLIVLISIETMDIMFAIDSIPAVFAITLDPFIVFTSNIFAILGLRALFFALAGLFYLFRFLSYGLAVVLAFVGVKMLLIDIYKLPTSLSLVVVFSLIAASILASVMFPKKAGETVCPPAEPHGP